MENFKLGVRPMTKDDEAFVASSWLRSFRKSDFARHILRSVYMKGHRTVIQSILGKPGTRVYIAHDPVAPVVMYGFLVTEVGGQRPVVHYAFVKAPFRRLGIFNEMVRVAGLDLRTVYFTHFTRDRVDTNPESPTYHQVRPGTEMLLKKYPLAKEAWDPKSKELLFTDGTVYCPYFMA